VNTPTSGSNPGGVTFDFSAVVPLSPTQPLTTSNHRLIAGFTCGRAGQQETRWERDVSDWINNTGSGGALDAIGLQPPTEVFLFQNDARSVMAYGTWLLLACPVSLPMPVTQ